MTEIETGGPQGLIAETPMEQSLATRKLWFSQKRVTSRQLSRPPRVLHVCESFASGVVSSINAIVGHSPDVEHTILVLRHRRHIADGERLPDVNYIDGGEKVSISNAIRLISQHYREIDPDIVHAHSTYAGVYVRLLSAIPRSKIVYTPHCYSFERTDVSPLVRATIRAIERVMTLRTGTVAAMSEREGELAKSLSKHQHVAVAINVPDVPDRWCRTASPSVPHHPIRVTTVGRICAQKDPHFLSDVVRLSKNQDPPIEWTWIGDGDTFMRKELEGLGVIVTGWVDRRTVFDGLKNSHVYLHSAAWEIGVPICVLEAGAVGVPAVVRSVPSTCNSAIGILVDTPHEAWQKIQFLSTSDPWHTQSEAGAKYVEGVASSEQLTAMLASLYAL